MYSGYYYKFSEYLMSRFGEKVRRIGLDPGFPCPHRHAVSNEGGCIYCGESAFSDTVSRQLSLKDQLAFGIERCVLRGVRKHIAYFQNSTTTNASVRELKQAFDTIRQFPSVVALSISTRPDCVDDEKLDLIARYMKEYEVWMEYGLQSAQDSTLQKINRGHNFATTREAIKKTASKGIRSAVHVILGLPEESFDIMINTAREISGLPVWAVKLHVLHVIKGTELEKRYYSQGRLRLLTRQEYVRAACDFLEHIPEDIVIMRLVSDARKEALVAPDWITSKLSVIKAIECEFSQRDTRQGVKTSERAHEN